MQTTSSGVYVASTELTTAGPSTSVPQKLTQCFKPRPVSNAGVTLYQDIYGVVAVYTCRLGYRFAGGATTRTALCIDGSWIMVAEDCIRRFIIVSATTYDCDAEIYFTYSFSRCLHNSFHVLPR